MQNNSSPSIKNDVFLKLLFRHQCILLLELRMRTKSEHSGKVLQIWFGVLVETKKNWSAKLPHPVLKISNKLRQDKLHYLCTEINCITYAQKDCLRNMKMITKNSHKIRWIWLTLSTREKVNGNIPKISQQGIVTGVIFFNYIFKRKCKHQWYLIPPILEV